MKRLLTLLLTAISLSSYAQVCDYYILYGEPYPDSTENRLSIDTTDQNNVWQIGIADKQVIDNMVTPIIITDTLNPYPPNDTSSFTLKIPKNFTWAGLWEIQFFYQLDVDSGDYGIITYSQDGGLTWGNVPNTTGSNIFTQSTSGWTEVTMNYLLTVVDTNSNVLIRFTFISDSIPSNKDGWGIGGICVMYWWESSVEQVEQSNLITFYPNPSTGSIKIQSTTNTKNASIQVFNVSGQKVYETNRIPSSSNLDLPLPDGMYLLKYSDEKETAVKRFLIQH